MCTYLHKAPNGVYYFRMGIPAELRPHFDGKREIKQSLGTKDREAAKRLIPARTEAARALMDQGKANAALVSQRPAQAKSHAELERERRQEEIKFENAEWVSDQMLALEFEMEEFGPVIDALGRGEAVEVPPDVIARAAYLGIQDARADLSSMKARYEYVPTAEELADTEPLALSVGRAGKQAASDLYLDTDIWERWKAEGDKRPKSISMVEKSALWFNDRVGRMPVREITKSHILEFKDKLLAEGQSVANVNTRLSHISLLLGWAERNAIVPVNVAKGTPIPVKRSKANQRLPFDLGALRAIFGSPVYAAGERPVRGRGEAAYWLPVLALYTGARVRELAQLRRRDVIQIEYADENAILHKHWFLHITEGKDDEGQVVAVKNDASIRNVPVHPKLIDLGFIDYVQALDNQRGRIFPELKEDKYGNPAAKWGEWFGSYLRDVCHVSNKRMTFHSFRHTFKDYARNAMIPEAAQRQIMGHEGGDVADNYGLGFSPEVLVRAMERYRVPGLDVPSAVAA